MTKLEYLRDQIEDLLSVEFENRLELKRLRAEVKQLRAKFNQTQGNWERCPGCNQLFARGDYTPCD